MSTPLSAAHRDWRTKVFVATWLSYVGFYFCRKPWSVAKSSIGKEAGFDATTLGQIGAAYLIAYAIGQFLAGGMGTRFGPRVNVLLGMGLSIVVTLMMGITLDAYVLAGLVAVNGLAQATGWSGNVGTMAAWFHQHERGKVMGAWATNFTVGSLASTWVLSWVLGLGAWRATFYAGAAFLAAIWVQFYFLQRNKPEDVGLAPVDDPVTAEDESKEASGTANDGWLGLSRTAWTNIFLVAGFYFFAKLIRYAIWSWVPYFLDLNYGLDKEAAGYYSTAFDIMGIPGVWVTGWISDRYFKSRRADVALLMMLLMTAACGALMVLGSTSVVVFAILLGVVGFSLYGPDALLTGAGAMDIGSRKGAVLAAGIISGFGSLGPIVQELVIGKLYDSANGDLTAVFVLLFGSAALSAAFCAGLVWRRKLGFQSV
ncbi:MAG: MFS transporter [Deltaproteobacteria bacterium]|nr:MFS transporter [Deltaproteobacteria bacterium]